MTLILISIFLFGFITTNAIQQCPIGTHLSFDQHKCIFLAFDKFYFDAENDCKLQAIQLGFASDNAFLVTISNAFENANVLAIANADSGNCTESFIGLNNIDNGWKWIDGTAFGYTHWHPGCPNSNSEQSKQCVTIDSSGRWCNRNCASRYCYICEIILSDSTTTTMALTTTTTIPSVMTDCYDWRFFNGSTSNGIYRIDPGYGLEPFDVYCDMITDGGGWTVIQRRVDDSLEFWNNTWQQYKNGFNNGIENGNLWLGNDRIHVISQSNVTLRIEINGNRMPNNTNPNIYLYSTYNFSISNEMNDYTLQISQPIEGNASKPNEIHGFYWSNGMRFSTVDNATDQDVSECANGYQFGGWWFYVCVGIALNGKYNPSNESYYGFRWYSQATDVILPVRSEMKIRRQ